MTTTNIKSEIRTLLEDILKLKIKENELTVLGTSEKGDNYLGDIIFVNLDGENNKKIVLKRGKKSTELRQNTPIKDVFENEIYMYDKVMPSFLNFLKEKGIKQPLNDVPKCYGTLNLDYDEEMIVLENLNYDGYKMHERSRTMDRAHLKLILRAYAKWHAISMALNDQKPELFKNLKANLVHVWGAFLKNPITMDMMIKSVTQGQDWLKGYISNNAYEKLGNYIQQLPSVIESLGEIPPHKPHYVITHGDGWNNNFLFKYKNGKPVEVKILDWQLSRCYSPLYDLAYCLYTTTSKEDVENLDVLLNFYYDNLSKELDLLGSDVENIFPYVTFTEEWAQISKTLMSMTFTITKVCVMPKEQTFDLGDLADGENPFEGFLCDFKDKTAYVERVGPVVEYVVRNNYL